VPTPDALAAEIIERLTYSIGKDAKVAKPHDWLTATILVIRDRVIDRWMESTRKTYETAGKRVYYLSLEFLIGRLTRDAVSNLEMLDEVRAALQSLAC
jgi:starch phosphorylase